MKKLAITLVYLLLPAFFWAQNPEEYKLVVYNFENLFDADGITVYDDYRPTNLPTTNSPIHQFTNHLTKVTPLVWVKPVDSIRMIYLPLASCAPSSET